MTNPVYNTQNNNKCPHGFPTGTCPICNGMSSSAPKDKNKPRVAGEMSYNECMAEWLRMQKAKDAKLQAEIDKMQQIREGAIKERMLKEIERFQQKIDKQFNDAIQKLDRALEKLPSPVANVIKAIAVPVIRVVQFIAVQIVRIASVAVNFALSVGEKIASVFGEIKNFIGAFLENSVKNAKKTIKMVLSLFMEFKEGEDEEEKQKLKKIIESVFSKKINPKDEVKKEGNKELLESKEK